MSLRLFRKIRFVTVRYSGSDDSNSHRPLDISNGDGEFGDDTVRNIEHRPLDISNQRKNNNKKEQKREITAQVDHANNDDSSSLSLFLF